MADINRLSFSEFEPSGSTEWYRQVQKDLGEKEAEAFINAVSEEINIPSFLSEEDISGTSNPAKAPVNPEYAYRNDWDSSVNVSTSDLNLANKQAITALEHGASAIRFTGHEISDEKELRQCLKGILPDVAGIHFDCDEASPALLFMYQDEIASAGLDLSKIKGSVTYDPLTDFAFKGNFDYSKKESFSLLSSLIKFGSDSLPQFRTLTLKATHWHNAGATAVQELAFSMASLNEYFMAFTNTVAPEILARSTQLQLCSGADYFLNIAKMRSARILWGMLLEGYKLNSFDIPLYLSTETALRNKTMYDPINNLLRATTESMAAVIGGCDIHTVHPHDVVFREPSEMSQRLALNIHHLLKFESHFDKVYDPSAGSYYIEKLTRELCEKAWDLFLEIEEKGGFSKSLEKGIIQEKVKASRSDIEKNVRFRKRTLTGVTHYAAAEEKAEQHLEYMQDPLTKLPEIKTVEPFMEAMVFESFRRMFRMEKEQKAFLAVFGNKTKSLARADFSVDFLSIAGFESIKGNINVSLSEQLESPEAKSSSLIVLCSADEEYEAAVERIAVSGWPQQPVLIAGKPANHQNLMEAGVEDFIFNGVDAVMIFQNLSAEILG